MRVEKVVGLGPECDRTARNDRKRVYREMPIFKGFCVFQSVPLDTKLTAFCDAVTLFVAARWGLAATFDPLPALTRCPSERRRAAVD